MAHSDLLLAEFSGAKLDRAERARLEVALVDGLAAARKTWSAVELPAAAFWRQVAPHLSADVRPSIAIAQLHLADLYLACACLNGDEAALRHLDRTVVPDVLPALIARGLGGDELDEVVQRLRIRLLVASPGSPAGLARYYGRGRIGGFVRTAAVRVFINMRRDSQRRHAAGRTRGADALDSVARAVDDPALNHLKETYLADFRTSLRIAWERLEHDQRLILKYQLLDHLTIDHLARLYHIHRSTAARRVIAAREALAAHTYRELSRSLRLAEGEVSSVMRLIRSRLDGAATALGGLG